METTVGWACKSDSRKIKHIQFQPEKLTLLETDSSDTLVKTDADITDFGYNWQNLAVYDYKVL
jgi:hypothetical protein